MWGLLKLAPIKQQIYKIVNFKMANRNPAKGVCDSIILEITILTVLIM